MGAVRCSNAKVFRYALIARNQIDIAKYYEGTYNNSPEYQLLMRYARDVKTGWITPLVGFGTYRDAYQRIENELVGKTAANGTVITGQSDHFLQRVMGTMVDPEKLKEDLKKVTRSSVEVDDIIDAVLHGHVRPGIKYDKDGRPSQSVYNSVCLVSINPETGNLVQCNPFTRG